MAAILDIRSYIDQSINQSKESELLNSVYNIIWTFAMV